MQANRSSKQCFATGSVLSLLIPVLPFPWGSCTVVRCARFVVEFSDDRSLSCISRSLFLSTVPML
jgi:hypothetical protein